MENTIQLLQETLKGNLITVAEYGKLQQHVIVLNHLDANILQEIKPIIKAHFKQTKKYPLLLTLEELTDGLDVFPLEFLNIKLNHRILNGKDVFKDLKFNKKHIRRELEFEFRSKLINLRQGYLEVQNEKELNLITQNAVPTLLPILQGLLFLKNKDIPESTENMLTLVETTYKTDLSVLKRINKGNKEEIITDLITLLANLGHILDEMNVKNL